MRFRFKCRKFQGLGEANAGLGQKRELLEMEDAAWGLLHNAVVNYCKSLVGTVAANDPDDKVPLNYDQVFIWHFVPSVLVFPLNGEGGILRTFLLHTLQLQSWENL